MIVMVDEINGNKYMRVSEHKGLGEDGDNSWLIKDMHQELKSWGYLGGGRNALILRSDGEPALVTVREALARCHGGQVTPEQPPKGEHQANGVAEEAGRTVRDQARVLKLQVEARIGRKVALSEPIVPWLIRWAAMSISCFQTGKDGKSPYERQGGRKCDLPTVPFSVRQCCSECLKWLMTSIRPWTRGGAGESG